MEENTVELIDYFRVIWKRGKLIIVVTLVCTVAGVGAAMNSRSKAPPATLYGASAFIKIGKKVAMSSTNVYLVPVESPEDLVKTIPLRYDEKVEKGQGYHLEVKKIGESILQLTLDGRDKWVERVLGEIVDMLIEVHRIKAESSASAYESFIKKMEADAKMIEENISLIEASIIRMKNKEETYIDYMDSSGEEKLGEKNIGDLSVVWNMLYLKTIDKEIDLSKSRQNLRNIQWQLLMYQTTIGSFNDYNTKKSGKIRLTATTPRVKSSINTVIVAGVAGLIMSLLIVFFMEYLEESKSRRKLK